MKFSKSTEFMMAVIVALYLGFGVSAAQDAKPVPGPKNGNGPNDAGKFPSDPLKLLPAELDTINRTFQDMQPAIAEMQAAYKALIDSKSSKDRYAAADQLWIAVKQIEPMQKVQDDFLKKVKKDHNCEDCTLGNDGRLVRPPAKQTVKVEAGKDGDK